MTASTRVLVAPRRRNIARALRCAAAIGFVATLAGCGGGVDVQAVVAVPPPPPPVTALAIRLTQIGPAAVQVDWSDDPDVYQFYVDRNGYPLANVMATSLIDYSVVPGAQYCYQVSGYDAQGYLLATTDTACLVVAP